MYKIITTSALLPYVVLCDGEESGCIGSDEFIEQWPETVKRLSIPPFMEQAKYYISLDRQGANDSVYYTSNNKQFKKFVHSFGFKEAEGSTSDIAGFEEEFKKCGVNLSIGYTDNHTAHEKLYPVILERTIARVCGMLIKSAKYETFKYTEKKSV